jgi:hypothetical protein
MDNTVKLLRDATGDRASYLYFLYKELKDSGVENVEEIAKRAIFKFGQAKVGWIGKMEVPHDFVEFVGASPTREVIGLEVPVDTAERAEVRFTFCPLVDKWQKLGATPEELSTLCDIAMQVDEGTFSGTNIHMELPKSLARGEPYCQMILTLKNKAAAE